jgi:WD40 repeat protein
MGIMMKAFVASILLVALTMIPIQHMGSQSEQQIPPPTGRHVMVWSPDGYQLAIGTWEGDIVILTYNGTLVQKVNNGYGIFALSWSSDGKWLASSDESGTQKIWATKSWELEQSYHNQDKIYYSNISWKFDSLRVVFSSYSGYINTLKIGANDPDLITGAGDPYGIAWSPDGTKLAVGRSIALEIRDSITFQLLKSVSPLKSFIPSTQVAKVTWSPDGTRLVTSEFDSGEDEILRVWDAKTLTLLKQYRVPGKMIFSMEWSSDGKRLLTTSHANTVKIWNVDDGTFVEVYQGTEPLIGAVWNPLNDRVAIVKNTVTSQNIAQQFTTISVANLK